MIRFHREGHLYMSVYVSMCMCIELYLTSVNIYFKQHLFIFYYYYLVLDNYNIPGLTFVNK